MPYLETAPTTSARRHVERWRLESKHRSLESKYRPLKSNLDGNSTSPLQEAADAGLGWYGDWSDDSDQDGFVTADDSEQDGEDFAI